jgi:predicted hydrocarbon binding protein
MGMEEEQTYQHQLWAMKDYRMIILRSQTFVNIQKSIEENHGHEATAAFYEAGIDAGKSSTQALLLEWKERNMDFVDKWAEFYGPKGVGWFALKTVNTDEGLCISEITITKSFVAESYGRSDLPVCHFLAGFFVGTFKESCGMNLSCEEIECEAMGHSSCKFSFEAI